MATNLRVAPPLKFSRLTGIAHTLGCKFYELGKNRVVHHNYSVNYYQSIGIIRMSSDARPIALLDRANLTHPPNPLPTPVPSDVEVPDPAGKCLAPVLALRLAPVLALRLAPVLALRLAPGANGATGANGAPGTWANQVLEPVFPVLAT
jgi:hypothetical protein